MIVENNTENQINILLNEAFKNEDNVAVTDRQSNYIDGNNKVKTLRATQEIIKLFTENKSQNESNIIEEIECAASYHLHYHQSKINSSRCLMNFSVSTMSNFVCLFIHLNNNMNIPKEVHITVYAKAILKKYIEFRKFIHYTLYHTGIPTSVTVMSLYFFYVLRSKLPQYFNKLSSIYKVWLVSLLICNKVYLDNSYRNITWAKDLTELPIEEINYLEGIILKALNYNVWISAENFNFWVRQLEWYMDWLHFESISSTSIYPSYHSVKPSVPDIKEKDEISNQGANSNDSINNINNYGTNTCKSNQYDDVVIPASKVIQNYSSGNFQNNSVANNTLQQQHLLQQQRQLQQQLHQQYNTYHSSTTIINNINGNTTGVSSVVDENKAEYYNNNMDNSNEILHLINQLSINQHIPNSINNTLNTTIKSNKNSLLQQLHQYKINPELPIQIQIQELQKLLQQEQYQNYQQQIQQLHQQQIQQQQLHQQQFQQQQLQQLQQQQKLQQLQQNYNRENMDGNKIPLPVSNYYSNISSLASSTTSSLHNSSSAVATIVTTTTSMMTTTLSTNINDNPSSASMMNYNNNIHDNKKVPIVPVDNNYNYPSSNSIENYINNDLIKKWDGMTLSNHSTQLLVGLPNEMNGNSIIPTQTKPQINPNHEVVTKPIEAIGSNITKNSENLHKTNLSQNDSIHNLNSDYSEDSNITNIHSSNFDVDSVNSTSNNNINNNNNNKNLQNGNEKMSSKVNLSDKSEAIDIKKGTLINNKFYNQRQRTSEGDELKSSYDNLSQISKKSIRNSCINSIKLSTSFRSNNNMDHGRTNTTNENVKLYMDKYYNKNEDNEGSNENSSTQHELNFEKEDISGKIEVSKRASTLKDKIENSGIMNKSKETERIIEKDSYSLVSDSTVGINGEEQLTESPKYSKELMKEINTIQKKYSTRNLHYLVSAARNASIDDEKKDNSSESTSNNIESRKDNSSESTNNNIEFKFSSVEENMNCEKTKSIEIKSNIKVTDLKKINTTNVNTKDNKTEINSAKYESPFVISLHKPKPKPLDPVLPRSFKPLSLIFSKVKNSESQLDSGIDDDLLFDSEGNLIHKNDEKNTYSLFNDINSEDQSSELKDNKISDKKKISNLRKAEPKQSFKLENALETAFKRINTIKEDEVDENQSPNIKDYRMYFAPMNNFFDNMEFDSSLVTKIDKKYSKFSNKSHSISGGEMKYNNKINSISYEFF